MGPSDQPGPNVLSSVPLYRYSKPFQAQASLELKRHPEPPCARDYPVQPCSAIKRMIPDYGTDRDKLRAGGVQEQD